MIHVATHQLWFSSVVRPHLPARLTDVRPFRVRHLAISRRSNVRGQQPDKGILRVPFRSVSPADARRSPGTGSRRASPSSTNRSSMPVTLPFDTFRTPLSSLIFNPSGSRDSAAITSNRGKVVANSTRSRSRSTASIRREDFRMRSHSRRRDLLSGSPEVISRPPKWPAPDH